MDISWVQQEGGNVEPLLNEAVGMQAPVLKAAPAAAAAAAVAAPLSPAVAATGA